MVGSDESPHILFKKGKRNKFAVTTADTGFPGRQKKYFVLLSNAHVANVVGFPGFMFTRPETYLNNTYYIHVTLVSICKKKNEIIPKCIFALKCSCNMGFSISLSPIDTEPVVTSTSTFCKAVCILHIR